MKRLLLLVTLGATLIIVMACSSLGKARTATQLLHDVAPSVVRVYNADGEGTGFVAFEVGFVLTAFHVVGSVDSMLTVVAADGNEYRAMVLGADEALDIALLSVPDLKAPPLPLGITAETGDTVYAVGYPAGLVGEASVTQGIISAQRTAGDYGAAYLQTDAPINPGNSGGPLFNTLGEVIGVNVAALRGEAGEFEGMGFALSIDEVNGAYEAMRSGEVQVVPTAQARGDRPEGSQESTFTVCCGSVSIGPVAVSVSYPPSWVWYPWPIGVGGEFMIDIGSGPPSPKFTESGNAVWFPHTSDAAEAELWILARPDSCPAWMTTDECLRVAYKTGGVWTYSSGYVVPLVGTYMGPWGPVYVFEGESVEPGSDPNKMYYNHLYSVQAMYLRSLPDGGTLQLHFIKYTTASATVSAGEHADIRRVFDSIRVLEQ